MFLYNVSIIMEDTAHDSLLSWIKGHIQRHEAHDIKLLKMLDTPHEGQTYCLQVLVSNQDEIVKFQQEVLQEIQTLLGAEYAEKAFIFDSTMQYIDQV
ncbi:hypothetical protein GCM10022216_34730 [Sphingobacterium kyonggiense]|uniref:DUF4286 family protein n=1 Tax=Sphingobacterium kyonggiense TaxID=714075 RepID=A0ABP7Z6H5_9SPHI